MSADKDAAVAGAHGIELRSHTAWARLSRMHASLSALSDAITRARDADELLSRACSIAAASGDFLRASIRVVDRESGWIGVVATSGVAPEALAAFPVSVDPALPEGQTFAGEAFRSGRPLIVTNFADDPRSARMRGAVAAEGTRSMGFFPLRQAGETIGLLTLHGADHNSFDGEMQVLLERMVENIAFGLEHLASESRYRQTFELSGSGIAHVSLDGRLRRVNPQLCRMLGYAEDELVGRTVKEVSHPEDRDTTDAERLRIRKGEIKTARFEKRYLHKDGTTVWTALTVALARDARGAPAYEISMLEDITARKREERLVQLEHAVTRCLAEADGELPALKGVMGAVCKAEGSPIGRFFAVDEAASVLRFREAWGTDEPVVAEYIDKSRTKTYRRGEGLSGWVWEKREPLWVADVTKDGRSSGSSRTASGGLRGGAIVLPVIAQGNILGVLSFSRAETTVPDERLLRALQVIASQVGQFLQRKQDERALRESEARFRSLTDLSSDWYWELDEHFRFSKFEGKNQLAAAYNPAVSVVGRCVWDLPGIEQGSIDWTPHRETLFRHEAFRDLGYAYRDASGNRYYISADGEPIFDEAGRFVGYRGTSRDVTNQRRDEEQLRRFRAAMDVAPDMFLVVDTRTATLIDFNQSLCRALGYAREELIGRTVDVVRVDRTLDQLLSEYRACTNEDAKPTTIRVIYRRRDGSTFPVESKRMLLDTADGRVFVVSSRDLTEQLSAEVTREAHHRYREKVARLGELALAKRDAADLIEEAVQTVLEAMRGGAVAYLEASARSGEVVLRSIVGLRTARKGLCIHYMEDDPLNTVLHGGSATSIVDSASLHSWAPGMQAAHFTPVWGDNAVCGALCGLCEAAEELGEEERSFLLAAANILSMALQRVKSEQRLSFLAQFDALTLLPNRALLADRFTQMIGQTARRNRTLGVLFVDLDEFKLVNDTLGHGAGDDVLKEAARRLSSAVRNDDTVARISGDEFAVLLSDLARPEDAGLVAQKIIDCLAEPFRVAENETFISASIGIATYPADGADPEALLAAADAAMYRAKQAGRNAFQFFTAEINQRTRARANLGNELRRALERAEFTIHYQPKIDFRSGLPCGAEALLRWRHPERGLVSPAEFIPVLEETGLIVPVGEWVLCQVCEDLKQRLSEAQLELPVAVNLSARQFRQPDLEARIRGFIEMSGVKPGRLALEITESQLMNDPDHAIRTMQALRAAGIEIAIDDFGTGYSSLAYLTRFPVSALKIDRSFVKEMLDDKSQAAIVRTVIEMAQTLDFKVVAEGVETQAQATFLASLGCDEGQGYLFARPMPVDELEAFVSREAVTGDGNYEITPRVVAFPPRVWSRPKKRRRNRHRAIPKR